MKYFKIDSRFILIGLLLGCSANGVWQASPVKTENISSMPAHQAKQTFKAFLEQGKASAAEHRYDKAIVAFSKAIEIKADHSWAYLYRGKTYAEKERYDKAIADFTRALKLNPHHLWSYINRGKAYTARRQYEEAIADFTQAIALNPQHLWSYIYRGKLYTCQQRYDQALPDLSRAIELNPQRAWTYVERGVVYAHKQLYEQAVADINRAIELDPQLIEGYPEVRTRFQELEKQRLKGEKIQLKPSEERLLRKLLRQYNRAPGQNCSGEIITPSGERFNSIAGRNRSQIGKVGSSEEESECEFSKSIKRVPVPLMNLLYFSGRAMIKVLSGPLYDLDIQYKAELPKGPKIFASNHPTSIDPFLLFSITQEKISFLTTEILFRIPVFKSYLRLSGHVKIVKQEPLKAFNAARWLLLNGISIALYPEGAINRKNGLFRLLKTGVARLAFITGVPVIPLGVSVDYGRIQCIPTRIRNKRVVGTWYFKGPYAITIGKPLYLEGKVNDRDMAYAASELIMDHIRNLAEESAERINAAKI